MVVVCGCGDPLPGDNVYTPDKLFESCPKLLENALKLAAAKKKFVKPEGVLYARQKERSERL